MIDSFSSRYAIQLVVFLLAFFAVTTGQSSRQTGVLSILVLDKQGNPVQHDVRIEITGERLNKTAFIIPRGFFDLPYGTYTIRCMTDNMIGSPRFVIIRLPKTQIVFALTPKELDQITGEGDLTPWVIKGKVVPPPLTGKVAIARLISLYSDVLEDGVVAEDGTFTLYVWRWSSYKLWILTDGKRVAERDIDVSRQLPKDGTHLNIRMPENNPAR
jgi:hypothetical protein